MTTTTTSHTPETTDRWHVHIGTVQLFIVGPGPDAWLACSVPNYHGRPGTPEEMQIAQRAITWLESRDLHSKDAGPAEIHRALHLAAHSIATGTPILAPQALPDAAPQATQGSDLPVPFDDLLQLVSQVTGVAVEALLHIHGERHNSRTTPAIHARYMTYALLRDRHRFGITQLERHFHRHRGSFSQCLIAHDSRLRSCAGYRRTYKRILSLAARTLALPAA